MESFDKGNEMKHIEDQIRKAEAFSREFKNKFSRKINKELSRDFPPLKGDAELAKFIEIFGTQIFNSTESVIDKDNTYPPQRLAEEVETMQRLALRITDLGEFTELAQKLHKKAKALSAGHFKAVIDMSGNGFRLLEVNTKLHTWEFVSNLRAHLPKD